MLQSKQIISFRFRAILSHHYQLLGIKKPADYYRQARLIGQLKKDVL